MHCKCIQSRPRERRESDIFPRAWFFFFFAEDPLRKIQKKKWKTENMKNICRVFWTRRIPFDGTYYYMCCLYVYAMLSGSSMKGTEMIPGKIMESISPSEYFPDLPFTKMDEFQKTYPKNISKDISQKHSKRHVPKTFQKTCPKTIPKDISQKPFTLLRGWGELDSKFVVWCGSSGWGRRETCGHGAFDWEEMWYITNLSVSLNST